jgi:hypothetical protein
VAAFDTISGQPYFVDTVYNQDSYQITGLPAGTYHVVAYTLGGGSFPEGLKGGFTQAVPCGLRVECEDHSLIPVSVAPGGDTPGVDPLDWYYEADSFPPMPGPAPSGSTGSITGSLSYPSEFIPAMIVVAFQRDSDSYWYVETAENQSSYRIDNLPDGYYRVVAYAMNGALAGGYTQGVACYQVEDCTSTSHELVDIPVNIGQVVTDVDPVDWLPPEGVYPPYPVP